MTRRHISTRERAEILIEPLSDTERGRGVHLPKPREQEIVAECLRLMRNGVKQQDICFALNATRSRTARWCQAAAKTIGDRADRAALKTHGKTDLQFIWSRLDIRGPNECWNWTGAKKPSGYGTVHTSSGAKPAHRAVYEMFIGAADGLQVDHICQNRLCCNPNHLQAVSANINLYMIKARTNG